MSLLLSEDFETGSNGTAVTTSNTIADLVGGGPTISTAWSVNGTRSMDCNASGSSVTWRVPLGSLRAVVPVVVYFTIVGSITPSATAGLIVVRAGSTAQADVQVLTNGRIRIRNGGTQVWAASSALPTDVPLRAEYIADSASGTQQVAVYAGHSTTPISGQSSGSQTYSGGTNDTVVMGVTTAATYHVRYDAFRVYTSAGDLPAPLATPPTVDIGANPTIQDYHAYSFTPSVTGNNGTTTYAWSVLSGPSTAGGQFSTTSAKNTTFTPAGGPGTYTLRLRVHDDSGDTDATATVVVTALLASDGVDSAITTTSWTPSTGTAEQVLTGAVTGYITSSNNPSAQVLKFRMRGIIPPSGDYILTLTGLGRSGGTGTVDVSLIKPDGSTLVKKITGVVAPTTPADVQVTFQAADITGLTAANWRAGVVHQVDATAS